VGKKRGLPTERTASPDCVKSRSVMFPTCSVNVTVQNPEAVFQSLTLPSSPPVAKYLDETLAGIVPTIPKTRVKIN
jgi:hypothetical protein